MPELWSSDLMCCAERLEYDFRTQHGRLYLPEQNCAHMAGCIALFEAIDPNVETIKTFAGDRPDVGYRRRVGKYWYAEAPEGLERARRYIDPGDQP